ncbi:hypothetical protein GCM10028803_42300 [Larkinella knui]|uniref:Uncharacterized protein n=1 Tax=Larkinella knui TaxID=2025310 RepID=A0A3P1CNM8_9BACT|nr:hypothetical protein [Larkinella knui]RRB14859.1 hypothetical protein EHT87_09840 [Larkinella knui]
MKVSGVGFLLFLSLSWNTFSQACSESVLLATPGKWTEGMKGSTSGISAADLAREKVIVGTIHKIVLQGYKPQGVDADYNGVYYRSEAARSANMFGYNLRFMPYVCRENAIEKAHETNTSLSITANQIPFGPEIYEPFIDSSPWDAGFRSMRKMPVDKGGIYYFVEETGLGFGVRGMQYTWLITYEDKLPFLYVSKKEFLEKKRAKLTAGKEQEINTIKSTYTTRPKAEQDAMLQKSVKGFEAALAKVEAYLKLPDDELTKPAVVKQDPNDFLSHLFTTPDDRFANILIKPNPGYFNKKLPLSSPQFITVVLQGDEKNPILGKAMKDMQQGLDFGKLKAMLGK